MITYLLRRSLYGLLIVFLASIVMFSIVMVNPAGGPLNAAWNAAQSVPGFNYMTATERKATLDRIQEHLGLNQPVYVLYLKWLYNWEPTSDYNPGYLQNLLDYLTNLQATAVFNSREEADNVRLEMQQIKAQIPIAEAALANCQNLLDFSKLGGCLILPRVGGLMTGNWGPNVTRTIFGRGAGQYFDKDNHPITIEDQHWHSPFVNTLVLIAFALLLSLLLALPIGIYSAMKQYSTGDYFLSFLSFAGMALPVFWVGAVLLLFNSQLEKSGLPTLPLSGVTDDSNNQAQFGDIGIRLKHLLIPGVVLALTYMAGLSRFLRSSMLEVMGQEYVRTAWAKGLRPRTVILKHALRNALIPLVTRIALTVPLMLGSAVLVEHIFQYDGMGQLVYTAVTGDNWNLMMGLLVINSVIVVLSSIVADYAYAVVDPRIRY